MMVPGGRPLVRSAAAEERLQRNRITLQASGDIWSTTPLALKRRLGALSAPRPSKEEFFASKGNFQAITQTKGFTERVSNARIKGDWADS